MQELSEKLKESLVNHLMNNQDLDIPYLKSDDKILTKRDLANEIENETELGIRQMRNILLLSLDLMTRKNKQINKK